MAEKTIALDTSFIIGWIDEKDVWRAPTLALQSALENSSFQPIVFDCVLAEAVSVLARRVHEKRRVASLPELMAQLRAQFPPKLTVWVYPDLPVLYDDVIAVVEQSGGELNFNDSLIALAC
ncbi:MAG: hypothetical protein ACT4QE_25160 [Anaerolineales bacterium]